MLTFAVNAPTKGMAFPTACISYSIYSIVDFATYDDMKAALEKLDGEDWNGNRIRLVEVSFSVIII